jgi:hypothetical protein
VEVGGLVTIKHSDRSLTFQVTGLNSRILPSNREIIMIRCGDIKGLPSLAAKIWSYDDSSSKAFDEVEIWGASKLHQAVGNERTFLPMMTVWRVHVKTEPTNCGAFYIGRFNKTWRIFGMHNFLLTNVEHAMGALITRDELQKVAQALTTTLQGVETSRLMLSKTPSSI